MRRPDGSPENERSRKLFLRGVIAPGGNVTFRSVHAHESGIGQQAQLVVQVSGGLQVVGRDQGEDLPPPGRRRGVDEPQQIGLSSECEQSQLRLGAVLFG